MTREPYAYVGGSPLNRADPSGLFPCVFGWGDCDDGLNHGPEAGSAIAEVTVKGDGKIAVTWGANGWVYNDNLEVRVRHTTSRQIGAASALVSELRASRVNSRRALTVVLRKNGQVW